jgi:predicted porin
MKKSLLALAVLGAFAGAASAQSSVTIYGLLDLAVTKGNGGTAPNGGANGLSEAYIMKQSASSRLGFRGNEDMGGGLSAQFHIEHRFTPDDGVAASPFWAARSYVQLTSAAVGSVYLGREYGPEFWPAVKTDPFGWDGVGQIGGMQYAGFSTALNGASSIRTSNTLGYRSAKFGGVTAQVAVSLGENAAGAGRVVAGNLEYANGPIYAGVGLAKITDGTNDGHQLANFGFAWDFGMVRPAFYYAASKTGAAGVVKGNDIMVALTAPIGPGKLKAAWSRQDPNTNVNSNSFSKIGVGYDYSLSKRTNVYADYGRGTSQVAGTTANSAFAFGVKHTF